MHVCMQVSGEGGGEVACFHPHVHEFVVVWVHVCHEGGVRFGAWEEGEEGWMLGWDVRLIIGGGEK